LIIVNPDAAIRLSDLYNGVTKGLVNLLIGLPVFVFIYCVQGKIVKKRPEGFITKAMIKISDVLCRKKNRMAILYFKLIRNLLLFFL